MTWTRGDARILREAVGMNVPVFAREVGVRCDTVERWEAKPDRKIQPVNQLRLSAMYADLPKETQLRFRAMLRTAAHTTKETTSCAS